MFQVAHPLSADIQVDAGIQAFQPEERTWVKLRDRPHPYSDDEALLLCETAEGLWVAWVSNFGELLLQPGEFYRWE
jgi:hypothetical protein